MSRLRVNDNGVVRVITRIRVNDNGTVRTLSRIRVNDNGTVRIISASMYILGATSVYGSATGLPPTDISTIVTSCSVVGGTTPYTYLWTLDSSPSYTWTIAAPTVLNNQFTAHTIPNGANDIATFKLVVTDAGTNTATFYVEAEVDHF